MYYLLSLLMLTRTLNCLPWTPKDPKSTSQAPREYRRRQTPRTTVFCGFEGAWRPQQQGCGGRVIWARALGTDRTGPWS